MDDWKTLYQQKNGLHFTRIENCGKRLAKENEHDGMLQKL